MSNNQSSDHKITRFLSGKGFYLVLALCLAGAGTAAWLAVNNTVGDVEQSKPQNIAQLPPQEEQWGFPQLEEAGQTAPVQVMQSRQENLAEGPESEEKTSA